MPHATMPAPIASRHFVIPLVAGIGNAMMAEPMVRQLRTGLDRPDRVTVVASISAMGEPMRRIRGVEVIVCGKGAWKTFTGLRSVGAIDVLLVPFPSNRWQYNVLAMRSGATRVVVHGYPTARAWLSSRVGDRVEAIRGIHDVNQNLRLLDKLNIAPRLDDPPRFPLDKDDRHRADGLLRDAGAGDRPFVAMHAGSARTILAAAKRWPVEKYASLISSIRVETGWDVVLLEGPDERGVSEEILQSGDGAASAKVVRLAGPLGDAAGLLARARVYVGTDSGLAHVAAAVGTRAVTLFAPADPDRVAPFGNRDLVVKPAKSCSPCFLYPWDATKPKMRCRVPYCVTEISVEMVMEKMRAALTTVETAR
jgi:ADP-heptose:LPS heptosyltransferase